ncbi:MAG: YggS family pyridoxal phosphate-dependent enzyme [Candidatus Dormibacteraeota bacterium]|nr:YggS family pyridoxal phosphate-dependent enzyme [Candidatus Dormibacteraeota bacterium]
MTRDRAAVADALAAVRRRIETAAERAGRDPASIRLVAVTKGVDATRVAAAIEAGVSDVGENRVQEAAAKREAVGGEARWHLLGHLQTNKAKRAANPFDVVESVDSLRVAAALAEQRRALDAGPLDVLIEADLTGIQARTGAPEEELDALARAVAQLESVHLARLMTIAPPAADPGDAAPYFRRLAALREQLSQALALPLPELSMGMSDDFEVAIAEGATIVRIGRAIFGARDPVPLSR